MRLTAPVQFGEGCDPFSRNLEQSRGMGGGGYLVTFDNWMDVWVRAQSNSHPRSVRETAPPSCRRVTPGGMGLARGAKQEEAEPDCGIL